MIYYRTPRKLTFRIIGCTNIDEGKPFDKAKEVVNVAKHSISLARAGIPLEIEIDSAAGDFRLGAALFPLIGGIA